MTLTPAKAVALLVFLGAVAGATYGVQTLVDERIEGSLVSIEPLHPRLNATGGHAVTFAFNLLNRGDAPREVAVVATVAGVEARADAVSVPAEGETVVFMTFEVPEGAAVQAHAVDARLLDASGGGVRAREGIATLHVLAPAAEGFAAGDSARLRVTGLLHETGSVFESNDGALAGRTFARTTNFQQSDDDIVLAGPRLPTFPAGLYAGLAGMQPGESRTIVVEPADAFGPATLNTSRPRTETFERILEVPLTDLPLLPRAQFQQALASTGQGNAADYDVGDRFYELDPKTGNKFWFVIKEKTDSGIVRRFDPTLGETYTTIMAWPNATRVTGVNETTVTLTLEPPFEVGEPFTFYDYWPAKSAIKSVNETELVVEHSPDVGMSNEVRDPSGRSARRFTVESLTDEEIILRYPSPNVLAGKTLEYHVLMLEHEKP